MAKKSQLNAGGAKDVQMVYTEPLFSVNRPNHYVISRWEICLNCQRRKKLYPIEGPTISWDMLQNKGPKLEAGAKYCTMIRPTESLTQEQKVVKSFCVRCRGLTKLPGGKSFYEDCTPDWTLGNRRPLYVERRAQCLTCKELNRHSGRFVPVDATIPSICKRVLSNLAKEFGSLESHIIAVLLDHWPPSKRTFRSLIT